MKKSINDGNTPKADAYHDVLRSIERTQMDVMWIKRIVFVVVPAGFALLAIIFAIFFGVDVANFRSKVGQRLSDTAIAYAFEQASNSVCEAQAAAEEAKKSAGHAKASALNASSGALWVMKQQLAVNHRVEEVWLELQFGTEGSGISMRTSPRQTIYDFGNREFGEMIVGMWITPIENISAFNEFMQTCYMKTQFQQNRAELVLAKSKEPTGDVRAKAIAYILYRAEENTNTFQKSDSDSMR